MKHMTVANGGVSAGIHSQMELLLDNSVHITLHKLLGVSQCVNRRWAAHFPISTSAVLELQLCATMPG